MDVCMCVYMYGYVCVYVCVCMDMYVCMCVCIQHLGETCVKHCTITYFAFALIPLLYLIKTTKHVYM